MRSTLQWLMSIFSQTSASFSSINPLCCTLSEISLYRSNLHICSKCRLSFAHVFAIFPAMTETQTEVHFLEVTLMCSQQVQQRS